MDKPSIEKTLARIEFTPEQRKVIAQHAGRDIAAARIVELSADQTRAIAPGLLKAAAIVMCW
jgi:hypothetical protein